MKLNDPDDGPLWMAYGRERMPYATEETFAFALFKERDALRARVAGLEATLEPLVGHDDPAVHHAACAALNINPAQEGNLVLTDALNYLKNTNGRATLTDFIDHHEPSGPQLWADLTSKGFAIENANGRVILTNAGFEALKSCCPLESA